MATVNVNVDAEIKQEAEIILKELGFDMNTAINMFLEQIIITGGIPFEITNSKPSKDTLEALKEIEEMIKNPTKYPRYDNWEDLKENFK